MGWWIFSRREFVSAQQCAMNSAADVFKKPYSLAHQRVQNCRLQHSWRFIKKVITRPRIGFKCQAWYIFWSFYLNSCCSTCIQIIALLGLTFFTKMIYCTKGQIKPKADWRAVDSPIKKQMNLFCLLFSLFTANKPNSFICFLGECKLRPICFRFYLTFRKCSTWFAKMKFLA